ncbi:MAG TPA: ChbG/HpnK family deacetylase [Hyphomicrobiaceae bacterium]|nr:ChbG/HpnK family deacetylase [Hyphomicrobiaceae bacterium]
MHDCSLKTVILCADDYGLTEGVSRGIEELAVLRRISAASALVNLTGWPRYGPRLSAVRDRIAIGLHFNLTLGAPVGEMPRLAPFGVLPRLGPLLAAALAGRLEATEIAGEVCRQIDSFEQATGHAPDFIDGHQHVHALPGVRTAFLRAVASRFPAARPLIRDPGDDMRAILARGGAVAKALCVAGLARGFGEHARRSGFPVNRGFAGFSTFATSQPFERELNRFFTRPGPAHIVMCHPGYADAELARMDKVVGRRRHELDTLNTLPALDKMIWHPLRSEADGMPAWPTAAMAT